MDPNIVLSSDEMELAEKARKLGWDFKRVQELDNMLRMVNLKERAVVNRKKDRIGLKNQKYITYRGFLPSSSRNHQDKRNIGEGWAS